MKIRRCHPCAGDNYNIVPITNLHLHKTVIFTNQTPRAVSCDRISDFFADGNTEAALAVSVLFKVQDQKAGRLRTAFVIQTPKFMVLSYRYRLFHTILRTKNLSTSASSSCENLTAVCRAHSLSEAMLLLSVPFGRLICLKHVLHLLLFFFLKIRQIHDLHPIGHKYYHIISKLLPFVKLFWKYFKFCVSKSTL